MTEQQIARGVSSGIWQVILLIAVMQVIIFLVFRFTDFHRDETDAESFRSGLEIKTDCLTGLQYLATASGGLTPRVGSDGKQMMEACR